jgi:hypothetical protein
MRTTLLIILLQLSLITSGRCDSVSIIRVSDGKIVGRDSPKGEYVDWVVGLDETVGKVAVVEWGKYHSTIKVFSMEEGHFKKHSIPIGRYNGLDGADYYDFSSDDFIFHDEGGLRFFGKDSKPRKLSNPLPKDYRAGKIVPCKDGLLIKAGNCAGDYRGSVVYRYLKSDGSIKRIYESIEGVRCIRASGDYAILSEDIKGAAYSRQIVKIDLDGHVLSKMTAPMLSADCVSIRTNLLYDVGPWETNVCQLQEVGAENGMVLRKIEFPDVSGRIGSIDVVDNFAVVGHGQSADVLDVETRKTLRRFTSKLSWSCLLLMKFKNEIYCIVCD